jgi:hypothetical protein
MDESKQQLLDKLKSSNNILVTVGRDPSVDQLAALLGLTLYLNKQGKHAAAVFSGEVPSTLEFLKPEETIEKNTDSLRDFIIALDKSKADKLRYKVEDDVVRIFITPYKTSITQDDFEFSQGDFNVDMVVAIGVQRQEDLDEAIVAHGRILHDATVSSINTSPEGGIGTINWHMPGASSLSELVCDLVQSMDASLLDEQISTAILTGIVAETDRFSNEKTTAQTMSASAALMAAGANQQLVASKLQEPDGGFGGVDSQAGSQPEGENQTSDEASKPDDGTLEIAHEEGDEEAPSFELPEPDENAAESHDEPEESQDTTDDQPGPGLSAGSKLITDPPSMGGTLTSSTKEEGLDPSTDPFSMPTAEEPKILSRKDPLGSLPAEPDKPLENPPTQPDAPAPEPVETPLPPVPAPEPPQEPASPAAETAAPAAPKTDDAGYSTLADLEESINSPHAESTPYPSPETSDLDAARDEVSRALTEATAAGNFPPEPIHALNAQPMTEGIHTEPTTPDPAPAPSDVVSPDPQPQDEPQQPQAPQVTDPTAPPPVPPPLPPSFLGQQPPK